MTHTHIVWEIYYTKLTKQTTHNGRGKLLGSFCQKAEGPKTDPEQGKRMGVKLPKLHYKSHQLPLDRVNKMDNHNSNNDNDTIIIIIIIINSPRAISSRVSTEQLCLCVYVCCCVLCHHTHAQVVCCVTQEDITDRQAGITTGGFPL